ncbi:hypothetical protein DAEQUDRAFT_509052 [Daedalea quercina L-15889]|uniref:N-acetyltransferase domain-containing protein n=1 Tax=Daedalea quercina L-15889 TaxID=1314783 RepID=A0A165TAA5_9APHY|nr:hypothetical protein DAEQUDRAFT_509052 [Daedalea quercina L-15889]
METPTTTRVLRLLTCDDQRPCDAVEPPRWVLVVLGHIKSFRTSLVWWAINRTLLYQDFLQALVQSSALTGSKNMAGAPTLFRVKESDYSRLYAHLSPLLPQSLAILGPIEQHRDQSFDTPIWASFPSDEPPPTLFALFTIAGYQSRFFCSADASHEQPTPEQEAFVASFMESSVRAAYTHVAETRGLGDIAEGLIVGSVHGKWESGLRALPFTTRSFPVHKIVLPPSAARMFAEGASDENLPLGARVTKLEKSDLDMVVGYNKVQRPTWYVEGRLQQSVCIRVPGPEGAEVSVAWAFVHADSSLGQLHVVDAFRRRGLGREVLRRIVALRLAGAEGRTVHAPNELKDMTDGWNMVDAVVGNEGVGFYTRLEGWEEAWTTAWMTFNAPS